MTKELTTKERILKASRELFIKDGVRNVTMSDIAVHLGMSKRTIYENVENKGELIEACIDYFELVGEAHFKKMDKSIKMIKLIEVFMGYSAKVVESDLGTFFYEVKRYHPEIFATTIRKYKEKRVTRIIEFTEKGIAEGFFLKRTNVATIARLMSSILEEFEEKNMVGFDRKQFPMILRDIMIVFCRGMATKRGIEEIDRSFKMAGQ